MSYLVTRCYFILLRHLHVKWDLLYWLRVNKSSVFEKYAAVTYHNSATCDDGMPMSTSQSTSSEHCNRHSINACWRQQAHYITKVEEQHLNISGLFAVILEMKAAVVDDRQRAVHEHCNRQTLHSQQYIQRRNIRVYRLKIHSCLSTTTSLSSLSQ